MNARTKFWLKVALTVTFPVWVLPAVAISAAVLILYFVWGAASCLVDGDTGPHA